MTLVIKVGSKETELFYGAKKEVIKSRPLSVTLFYGLRKLIGDKSKLKKIQVECTDDVSLISCNVAKVTVEALRV